MESRTAWNVIMFLSKKELFPFPENHSTESAGTILSQLNDEQRSWQAVKPVRGKALQRQ